MSPAISDTLRLGLVLFGGGLLVLTAGALVLLGRVGRGGQEQDAARRILRNSALPFLIQLLIRAVDFAFIAVFFRLLPQGEAGDYSFAALLVSLYLGTISEWGLGVLLTRELARDRQGIAASFGTALLLRLLLSLAALPIAAVVIAGFQGLAALEVISFGVGGRAVELIAILSLTLLPGAFGSAITAVFLATERPIVPALANLLNSALSTILRLLALILGFGAVGVAWGALIATAINAAVFVWLLRRHFGWPGWHWDTGLARGMLAAAFPLMLNSLLMVVFFRFDTVIIRGFQGPEAVAAYEVAYKIPPIALIVPPVLVNALFPRFSRQARDDRDGLLRGYTMTLRLLLLVALLLAATVTVLAPSLSRIIVGQQYAANTLYRTATVTAMAVLVWFVPMSYVNGIAQYVLIALDRQAVIVRAFALTALFNLVMNLLLVPRWGIVAAAGITVASEVVLYLPLRRVLLSELGAAPLWSLLWRPLVAGVGSVGAMLLVPRPLAAMLVGVLVYVGLLVALRTFTEEDWRLAQRLVKRGR